MHGFEAKSFDSPDSTRECEGKGRLEFVSVGNRVIAKSHLEPGWQWSANVRPIDGGELCEWSHLAYCLSGRMRFHFKDGTHAEVTPGQVAFIPGGHDAEVIGDETCVMVDFGEVAEYARR